MPQFAELELKGRLSIPVYPYLVLSMTGRQHYIPRFYLRNFAEGDSKAFWQMEKPFKISKVNPDVTCWKRGIYGEEADKKLQEIEDKTSRIIATIVNGGMDEINTDDEGRIMELIWSLYIRSMEWGDIRDDEQAKKPIPGPTEDDMRAIRHDWLVEHPNLMSPFPKDKLGDYKLFYFENTSQYEFCTSDCPIYRPIIDKEITLDTFLQNGAGLAFYLPISPKKAIMAIPIDRVKKEPWSLLSKVTQTDNEDFAGLLNLHICFNAEKKVFARRESDLKTYASIIAATPGKLPSETMIMSILDDIARKK